MKIGKWDYLNRDGKSCIVDNSTTVLVCEKVKIRENAIKREIIRITAFKNDEEYCVVDIRLTAINDDLYRIRDSGILLKRSDIGDVERLLEDNYDSITYAAESEESYLDEHFDEILNMIAFKIVESGIYEDAEANSRNRYYIPVKDFASIIKESDHEEHIKLTELRKRLRDVGFTDCAIGRTDNNCPYNNNQKSIAFYVKAMKRRIMRLLEKNRHKEELIDEVQFDNKDTVTITSENWNDMSFGSTKAEIKDNGED